MNSRTYSRRDFLKAAGVGAASIALGGCGKSIFAGGEEGGNSKPNVVIIFTDDQGYQDVGCFGSPLIKTPNLDRMCAEGRKFTDFYVAGPVCSPSRAALMTGCYPLRVGIPKVLFPADVIGLNPAEVTIADVLKEQGYATACVGKWHLGHHKEFLPTRQGFDYYFGIPYSNDMRPENPEAWARQQKYPPLPIVENEETIEANPDQRYLTRRYTAKAVEFIGANKDQPFFLYLPHTMPHIPLYASEDFAGKSARGLYGDVIEEIDWSVGEILKTLKEAGVDEKTFVLFTSDNGPWLVQKEDGGSALPLRNGKGTTYEGGMREPCIMRWPGRIPAGTVCGEMCGTIDMLPTIAGLAGGKVPADRVIDGRDIWALISGKAGAKTPHDEFFYYNTNRLEAVRSGKWKLRKAPDAELYDLEGDISESKNVAAEHPELVEKLSERMRQFHAELMQTRRPAGTLEK